MAESSSKSPETASASESGKEGEPSEGWFKSRLREKKLPLVLSTAALGGVILGVSAMVLIKYLQPAPKEVPTPPAIVTPEPDPKQEALANEVAELKAKNEKLEEELHVSQAAMQDTLLPHADVTPPVPAPPVIHGHSAGAKSKEKVTADCTVPDQTEKLSDKLKSCIEGFNASTK